jgi:Kelch motif
MRILRYAAPFAALLVVVPAGAYLIGPSLMTGAGDMSEPRSEVHAAELDGVIYVAGGIGFQRTLKSCVAFEVSSQSFSDCPDLPRTLHHVGMAAGAFEGRGQVFATGGYSSLPFNQDPDGALFVFSPTDAEHEWRELSRLPEPLGQHAMFYREGKLWLIGGQSGDRTLGTIRTYDLVSGEWGEAQPMPTPRHSHAYAVSEGKLYVTGGRSDKLGPHATVIEVYDFASDSWESLPDAPFPLAGHGAAVFEGRLHVFGGEDVTTSEVFTHHFSVDLADSSSGWREETPMSAGRHGFAIWRVGDTAWILGGGELAGWKTLTSVTGTAFPLKLSR